ncbi:mediator of RNA polymerase II transcription subunit 8 [Aspergillus nanangensis]|uniref:Mediator of RNA polymerase II transcription subunit 8 n=1 Tax=Aspergillus nanangensis TaxID=2582783 RepID=A0AAD4CM57_ASPNN|nr:mediator of RNA polymerase II transcription subunit 8 [Aspergillus nanangensis]
MTTPSQDQIKTLEQSRQRLAHLTRSLASLITSLNQSDPLPTWSSLQSQATIISRNLGSVSEHLSENHELLTSLVAFPGPEYPGRTQANILEQLLRTKLDPRVDDWVARGRKAGTSALEDRGSLSERDLADLWDWAPVAANEDARRRNWGGNFTLEERESGIQNVVTGLKRQLEDDDDDDEDEDEEDDDQGEEDEMEIVGARKSGTGPGLEFDIAAVASQDQTPVAPVVPLGEILRYMTTGAPPGQR